MIWFDSNKGYNNEFIEKKKACFIKSVTINIILRFKEKSQRYDMVPHRMSAKNLIILLGTM